jgi:hypothetical protein
VRSLLQDVVYRIDPTILHEINLSQAQSALGLIRTSFRQAMDLLEHPERAPGWAYEDPVVLDSQGQLSRLIVRGIEAAAADTGLRQHPNIRTHAAGFVCARPTGG